MEHAQKYITDPLTAPDPSDETGLGSSLAVKPPRAETTTDPAAPPSTRPRNLSNSNPFRQDHASPKEISSTARDVTPDRAYPSPPPSGAARHSPRNSLGHRQEFLADPNRPRRKSSLKERYPGDTSLYPLGQLAKEKAEADRSKHVTKKHAVRPDLIDGLDDSGLGTYHHEGPFDATLFARNNEWKSSPIAAVSSGNEEALRATPHEKIVDSIQRHRPLDGVAAYPPGTTDRNGQIYQYQEGENMMTEENAGGKGEPSYSIEKALKEQSLEEKDEGGIEMTTNRNRSGSGAYRSEAFADESTGINRSGSLSNRLKKRVGSLKKKFADD